MFFGGIMKVALAPCRDYSPEHVYEAVKTAVTGADFPSLNGAKVLIKPNILFPSDPDKAIVTHPAVLEAAIIALKEKGAIVRVGESPAFQDSVAASKKFGHYDVAKKHGIEWEAFDADDTLKTPDGILVKQFMVAKAALECDYILSLAKLKTHQLMYYTGAIKNLFGLVRSLEKSRFHLRFPDPEHFAQMICDLGLGFPKTLGLIDGIIGMEGHGPANGTPRKIGLIGASTSLAALDHVCAGIIGYEPEELPTQKAAMKKGFDPSRIQIIGSPAKDFRISDYDLIKKTGDNGFIKRALPPALYAWVRNLFIAKPRFLHDKCIRCSACIKVCPALALKLVDMRKKDKKGFSKKIHIDYSKCIRCYCCHELCPEDAISIR
jgi:uncharacterized protein (DUF362 family)/Pyruvate/2-oxoacid:ferredoxin oxidoreductase delta subunit